VWRLHDAWAGNIAAFFLLLRGVAALLGTTFFVMIAVWPGVAQQVGDLNAIRNRIDGFYRAGNYPAALIEAQKYEAAVKARLGDNDAHYGGALIEPYAGRCSCQDALQRSFRTASGSPMVELVKSISATQHAVGRCGGMKPGGSGLGRNMPLHKSARERSRVAPGALRGSRDAPFTFLRAGSHPSSLSNRAASRSKSD
jgi:hypothetical protein